MTPADPDPTPTSFAAEDGGPRLVGWRRGTGRPVLLLHGGPGLSSDYLEGLASELGDGFCVAAYQQRGLAPSEETGPFSVDSHLTDVARVLDALEWKRATIVGHSWGGHLALHAAVAMPHRLLGALTVDTLGAVGDGGTAAFEAELAARTPADVRDRAEELDARALRGEGTEEEALESLRLVWPAYFPSRDAAPPMPAMRLSVPCYSETYASLVEELPRLEAALPTIAVPVGLLAGARSPMPLEASTGTADRIPGAWAEVVGAAGHFPWLDVPGCVRAALVRLLGDTAG
jgi:pimeloyl-ACP methyl ester carboxylesterase